MLKWLAQKWPHFDITKKVEGIETLYLRRWFIFRSKYFNIYLHHIARPDEDPDPHDHPWNFLSVLLRGGYTEAQYKMGILNLPPSPLTNVTSCYRRLYLGTTTRSCPSIGYRKAETVHQIETVKPNTWTLVFTGRDRRDWGFVDFWKGWIFWREYLNFWDKVEMD